MTRHTPVRSSLLLLAFVAAACTAVETGTVSVGIGCTGAACGSSQREMHVAVTDCDEDVGVYGEAVRQGALLDSSAEQTFGFDDVPEGLRCVNAFLDVNTNGRLDAGDLVSAEAGELDDNGDGDPDADDDVIEPENEIPVRVVEDDTVSVDVVLDTVFE